MCVVSVKCTYGETIGVAEGHDVGVGVCRGAMLSHAGEGVAAGRGMAVEAAQPPKRFCDARMMAKDER